MSALVTNVAPRSSQSTSGAGRRSPVDHAPPRAAAPACEIRKLRIVADVDDQLDTATLEREFPTIIVERVGEPQPGDLVIDDFAWRGSFEFGPLDEIVERARPLECIAVRGADGVGVAVEVMARYQRLVLRRNTASSTPLFDAVLAAHASLFDASRRPDRDHAIDTWQWLLRLQPNSGFAVQVAALFHDVERLSVQEPHERLEHRHLRSADPSAVERATERTRGLLRDVGVPDAEAARASALVAGDPHDNPLAAGLGDADALSFLSLLSAPYADHFGLAQTRRKVTFVVGRLGKAAKERVALLRLRPDIDRLIRGVSRGG